MTEWLDHMAADKSPLTTDKVVRNKPGSAVDACWDAAGKRFDERASIDGKGTCNTLFPVHSEPRLIAGAPLTNDVLKCRLKPINYSGIRWPSPMRRKREWRHLSWRSAISANLASSRFPQGTYQKY
jgi:hypothetical protein